jgi:exodeoxyribonuclease VII small subunit
VYALLFPDVVKTTSFGDFPGARQNMAAKNDAPIVGTLTFEAALKELEGIVARLEQGQVDLEDSITLYERGQALKAHCESKLKVAESRLEKIVLNGGQLGADPVDVG